MINRINLLLKAKNITARTFAEEIGIQPSGMSHILSGRNNPSLDFVTKVVRRYPEISTDWLIFGEGEMLKSFTPQAKESVPKPPAAPYTYAPSPTLQTEFFEDINQSNNDDILPIEELDDIPEPALNEKNEPAPTEISPRESAQQPANRVGKQIEKIILFYTDHTFEVFEG